MSKNTGLLVFSVLIFSLSSCSKEEPAFQLIIVPVENQREITPYYFNMADSLVGTGQPYLQLKGGTIEYPVQQVNDDQWVFIPGIIPAGESRSYNLVIKEVAPTSMVSMDVIDGKLDVIVEKKPVLTYQMKTLMPPVGNPDYYQKGGFIHPAYAPNGQVITDGFPVGHMHQHGIFFAWVNTRFQGRDVDFWNQQDETGTVVFDSLINYKEGPVFGEFTTAQTAVALSGDDTTKVLKEKWKVRVYNISDYFLWDIEVNQENISQEILEILQYHYGGMAFRGSALWNDTTAENRVELTGPGQGGFLTSEGLGRAGNHTRPDWVSMFGQVNNQPVHLVAISHPLNFRSPQFTRIHPTMPYFCFLPMVENGFDFKPGDVHKARYRVMTMNGAPDSDLIDDLSSQYHSHSK